MSTNGSCIRKCEIALKKIWVDFCMYICASFFCANYLNGTNEKTCNWQFKTSCIFAHPPSATILACKCISYPAIESFLMTTNTNCLEKISILLPYYHAHEMANIPMESLPSKGNTKRERKKQKIKVIGDNIKFCLRNLSHHYKFAHFSYVGIVDVGTVCMNASPWVISPSYDWRRI